MAESTKKKSNKHLPGFLVGLVVGVAGALLVPKLLTDHFEGTVTGKKRLRDLLMVMINMPDHGEVIATFTDKIGQIDFLIRPGDTVSLGLVKNEVLVDDPPLTGVKRVDGGTIIEDDAPDPTAEPESASSTLPGPAGDSGILELMADEPMGEESTAGEPTAGESANDAAEPEQPPGGDA